MNLLIDMVRRWGNATGALVLMVAALFSFAAINCVNLRRLQAAVDALPSSPIIEYTVDDTWHDDEPPDGVAIVGLWYAGDTVSSLTVIRAYGAYYSANPGRQAPIETTPPALWAYLP